MTTPLFQDHPDWVRTVAASAVEVVNFQAVQGVLTLDHGTFFVGNLPYLWMRTFAGTGGVRARFSWRTTKTGATFATNFVDSVNGIVADGPLRVVAPWVNIATLADVVGRVIGLSVYQDAQEAQVQTDVAHSGLIAVDGVAVGAGATRVDDANRVRWGWGHWHADIEAASNWRIRLLAVDYLGATRVVDFVTNQVRGQSAVITLPPQPLRLESLNADAAPQNLWAAVYSHPGPM